MTVSLEIFIIIVAFIIAVAVAFLDERLRWLYGLSEVIIATAGLIFHFFPADVNPFGSGNQAIFLPALSGFVEFMIIFYILADGMSNIRRGLPKAWRRCIWRCIRLCGPLRRFMLQVGR